MIAAVLVAMAAPSATAASLTFDNDNGLSGTADFLLLGPTALEIVLRNTSSNPNPTPGEAANGILTSIAFDLPGDITIVGGSAALTAGSQTINFDRISQQLTGGADVSGEWGFGNSGGTGFGDLLNYVSAMKAGTDPFSDPKANNLDGAPNLDGPEAGLVAPGWNPGGLGGIEDSITISMELSKPISDLSFLDNGAAIEFGSDYLFLTITPPEPPGPPPPPPPPPPDPNTDVPEPVTCVLVGLGGLAVLRHIRRHKRLGRAQAEPGQT